MKILLALALLFTCTTRAAAQPQHSTTSSVAASSTPSPILTKRLSGWFDRTSLVEPQPSELALSDFSTGFDSSNRGRPHFVALFFRPNLVVDACGLVRTIAPDDADIIDIGVDFFNTVGHQFKRWATTTKVFDLSIITLVSRMGPGSPSVVSSSIYAWPASRPSRSGWYWGWVRWRDEQLQRWLGWQVKKDPREWPEELDAVLELMSETWSCGTIYSHSPERRLGLRELIEKNPNGTLTLANYEWMNVSQGLDGAVTSDTHAEL